MRLQIVVWAAVVLSLAGLVRPQNSVARDLGDLKISAERVPVWDPGIAGGIPDTSRWPVIDATEFGAKPNDGKDDTRAINAAIAQAAKDGGRKVVFLPRGTYRFCLKTSIVLKPNVVLRGAGMHKTVITGDKGRPHPSAGWAAVHVVGTFGPRIEVTDTALPRGTTHITLTDAAGLCVGDFACLRLNAHDPAYVQHRAQWAKGKSSMTHVFKVSAKAGNRISMDRPLRHAFNTALGVHVLRMDPIVNAGLEDLKVMNDDDSEDKYIPIVAFDRAVNCWARNVFFYNGHRYHLSFRDSARNTVENCLFERLLFAERTKTKARAYNNYSVVCGWGAIDNLIWNSVFVDLFISVKLDCGANGNVYAYNYHVGRKRSHGIFFHGHYPHSNLVEGNDAYASVCFDNYWGQQGPRNTLFRNRLRAKGHFKTENNTSQKPPFIADRINVIGNTCFAIYGTPFSQYEKGNSKDFDQQTTNMWLERNVVRDTRPDIVPDWAKNNPDGANCWGLVLRTPNPTTVMQDNVEALKAPPEWKDCRIPPSLYLDKPPHFWPEHKPWPCLGADVDDFESGDLVKLPAQEWYERQMSE
ncbi:MAG: hypothetical protein JXR37_26460 [Kiritimatiellae bacterium]|nr:hypothetical protein [Kiritimatiellia bacterium]